MSNNDFKREPPISEPSPFSSQNQSKRSHSMLSEHNTMLPKEIEEGNVEYKLQLLAPTPDRFQHLVTQMKWRLAEGGGEALYEIGIADNGQLVGLSQGDLEASLSTLKSMGEALNADVSILRQRVVQQDPEARMVAEVLVRKYIDEEQGFMELKVAVIGGLDSGKSTLLGLLSYDELDNGRGKARLNLLRHRHEIASGRTSSIARQMIGFDASGEIVNFSKNNIRTIEHICESSPKVITFLDTCGHPKYQKTTISGLTGHNPDYACLIVACNSLSLPETAREHLGIAVALNVPVFICMTKTDIASPEQLTKTVSALLALLKSPGLKRVPLVIQNDDDVVASIHSFTASKVVPIFLVSNVTGENISMLTKFLNLLPKPPRDLERLLDSTMEYQIEEIYNLPSVGCVVGGMLISGRMNLSDQSYIKAVLGPDKGSFIDIKIHSIHRQRSGTRAIQAGQAATCAITFPNADGTESSQSPAGFRLRKGQVILEHHPMEAYWELEAEIHVLYHSTKLSSGSQGVIYCGNVRQGARVTQVEEGSPIPSPLNPTVPDVFSLSSSLSSAGSIPSPITSGEPSAKLSVRYGLSTGRRGIVRFRFVYEPEWLSIGRTLLFRGEGRAKCVGRVLALYPGQSSANQR